MLTAILGLRLKYRSFPATVQAPLEWTNDGNNSISGAETSDPKPADRLPANNLTDSTVPCIFQLPANKGFAIRNFPL